MLKNLNVLALATFFCSLHPLLGADAVSSGALWRQPGDIHSRDLFYGPGGRQHEPHGSFTFEKEDFDGTNPKLVVRDSDGVKWKVKLGEEARPETVATRLIWAVGYFADEDYFIPQIQVAAMPAHLHRGQDLVGPGGTVRNVRMRRYLKSEDKVGEWKWRKSPFAGSREFNGLRVMMALINNWDLKDENNAVFDVDHKGSAPEKIYLVRDLGSSFGTTGRSITRAASKGNLHAYADSRFISKVAHGYVDFNVPTRPAMIHIFEFPEFVRRIELRSIGKHIPEADCKWVGGLLGELSPAQIRDSFRAAGYEQNAIEGFAQAVEGRIAELNRL